MGEHEWTNEELIAEARRRGYNLNERRISSFTAAGLIDKATLHPAGRGSNPGVRSEHQAEVLWSVLEQSRHARKPATLANVPVFIWLGWGERYVPIRQVRRCLRTYTDAYNTASQAACRRTTDELLRSLHLSKVPARARNQLAEVISELNVQPRATLDNHRDAFRDALRDVVAPDGGRLELPHIDAMVGYVDLRVRAAHVFFSQTDEHLLPDAAFHRARLNWRESRADYIRDSQRPIETVNDEMAQGACLSLLALLGHELRLAESRAT